MEIDKHTKSNNETINTTDDTSVLLSICMPTYNQPNAARRVLESVLPQLTPEVEIVVRDDSTNNETQKIVDEYVKKAPIRYFHGKRDGLDVAIIFLTEEARGKYVWWLGDDSLAPGAIERVLELLKKFPDISLILVNFQIIGGEPFVAIKSTEDKFFRDRNEALETNVNLLGFISSNIFKRKKALSGIESSKKFIGSAFVCLYLILHVLSQDGKFYFLQKPFILIYSKPQEEALYPYYDAFKVFGINLFNVVSEFKEKFDKNSIKKVFSFQFGYLWKAVIVRRAVGDTTDFGSKTITFGRIFELYRHFPEFWIVLPLLVTPRWVLRLLYKVYKYCFPHGRSGS